MGQSTTTHRRRAIKWVVPLVLVGYALSGRSCARVRPVEQSIAPALRVMTYNLDKDSTRMEEAIGVIEKAAPDVVFFQEASAEWQQLLRSRLGFGYPFASFNQPKIGYDGIGMLSKFPISDERWLDKTGGGWFPSQLVILETPVGPVQFLNVHLRPPSSDTGNKVVGYLTTGPVRRREIDALHAQLRPLVATVIAGDFNESEDGSAVKFLRGKGFTDALAEFDRKSSTWQGKYLGVNLTDRPDHLLHSGDIHCFEARVIPENASDHDPVLAVVGLRSPK